MPTLFDPIPLGPYELRNRIFMAPMTRGRATSAGVPTDIMPTYYRQRSGAGLIVIGCLIAARKRPEQSAV